MLAEVTSLDILLRGTLICDKPASHGLLIDSNNWACQTGQGTDLGGDLKMRPTSAPLPPLPYETV